ncbi:hypothetical protein THAOC_28484, partial [Thalassiosira oceanica]
MLAGTVLLDWKGGQRGERTIPGQAAAAESQGEVLSVPCGLWSVVSGQRHSGPLPRGNRPRVPSEVTDSSRDEMHGNTEKGRKALQSHGLHHGRSQLRRAPRHVDTRLTQRGELLLRPTLPPRDDGAGVSHPPSRRRRHPRDEPHDRLARVAVARPPLGRLLLGRAADLADHDDPLGLGVVAEPLEAVDEVRAVEGVAPDADAGALPEPGHGRLVHGLVGQRPRPADDADLALLVDVPR